MVNFGRNLGHDMRTLTLSLAMIAFAAPVSAGEVKPSSTGHLIGADGQKWVVEGCVAYPVTSASNTRDKAEQMSKWVKPAKHTPKLKQTKPLK